MSGPAEINRVVSSTAVQLLSPSPCVTETHDGAVVWQSHAASIAYAWSAPIEGGDKRRFVAVPHQRPVKSPLEAVRAAIVAESRTK